MKKKIILVSLYLGLYHHLHHHHHHHPYVTFNILCAAG